ncbi:hypothetical protein IFM89_027165 [Coptis chinensis]|uniref:homogentisate 1,2-dioxygenase n=1 Tax=Coptis chinensis TaxID=261450 RepID=A0A835IFB8_9MAGN|nr:hypothetical protein IFM89_027165 [Coptis chinensis]
MKPFLLPSIRRYSFWLYRIKPSVTHEPFKPRVPSHEKLVSEFNQTNSFANPTQLRWKPVEIPDSPTDFIDGLFTMCGAGSSFLRHGYANHMYTANKSMENFAFCSADGDFLVVPQKGRENLGIPESDYEDGKLRFDDFGGTSQFFSWRIRY